MRNKNALVTGGAGFIGSHLVDSLLEEGFNVLVLDNLSTGDIHNVDKQATFIPVDFAEDDIERYFHDIDYVFHVGAWGRMPMCLEDPVGAYKNNVLGSVKVLDAALKAGVKKVVLSSSCIVYCEETPYKSSKIAMEDIARVYREAYGLQTICLRYANVYGTRQNIDKDSAMFAMLKKSMNEQGHVNIFGDGEQTRDWMHVKDCCRANIMAALDPTAVGEVDIATGRSISLNYIIKDLLKVPFEHLPERKGDARHINLDNTKAKELLGFETNITLEEGIKEVWS